jgi:hypothetical protein
MPPIEPTKEPREDIVPLTPEELDDLQRLSSKSIRAVADHVTGREKSLGYKWHMFKYWIEERNPLDVYIHAKNTEEYFDMPHSKRHVWFFWYKYVLITGGGLDNLLGRKKDRDIISEYILKNYPIQSRARKIGYRLWRKFSNACDKINYFIFPRQKWLTEKIPNEWSDKTSLILDLNFEMVVNFVETEMAYESTDWEAMDQDADVFQKELRDCYTYIKIRRPKLQEQYDNSYPDPERPSREFGIDYAENIRIELEMDKEDTKYLVWIVTNRDWLWT